MGKKQKIIIIGEYLLILLFLFVIGSGVVSSPLFGDVNLIDEGQFGAWLRHMLAGKHLYKDMYAAYGPLYIYPLYLLAKVFSPTVFLIRIVYIVINTFLAVIIARVILRELKIQYFLQVICTVLLLVIPGFGMRQGIALLTIYLFYKSVTEKQFFWSIFAGITLSISFLVSSDMGIFSTVVCGSLLFFQLLKVENIKFLLKKLLLILLPFAVVWSPFFVWSSREGWFFAYVNSIVTDLTIYSGIALPNGQNFPNALQLMPHSFSLLSWIKYIFSKQMLLYWLYFFYLITFIFFIIKIVLKRFTQNELLVLLLALFGFLLSTILIGRSGHFTFTLAPVFILFAYYLTTLLKIYGSTLLKTEKLFASFCILLIFIFSIRLISIYRPHFTKVFVIPKAVYSNKNKVAYVGPIVISNAQAKSFQKIQSFVWSHTKKEDSIFFLNNEPIMYLLVNRDNAATYDLPEVANTKEKRMAVLDDLITHKPKYIIYDLDAWSVDDVSNKTRLPEVTNYINAHYRKTTLDNFLIYILKE